ELGKARRPTDQVKNALVLVGLEAVLCDQRGGDGRLVGFHREYVTRRLSIYTRCRQGIHVYYSVSLPASRRQSAVAAEEEHAGVDLAARAFAEPRDRQVELLDHQAGLARLVAGLPEKRARANLVEPHAVAREAGLEGGQFLIGQWVDRFGVRHPFHDGLETEEGAKPHEVADV